jgi:hypothetical protein
LHPVYCGVTSGYLSIATGLEIANGIRAAVLMLLAVEYARKLKEDDANQSEQL